MGIDGTAIAAAGKRALALGLLLGALTVLALLLGTGSAQAKEKGLGHALGLKTGHHHASTTTHAKKSNARTHAAPRARHTARHTIRHTVRQVVAPQPVRRTLTPVTKSTTPKSGPAKRPAASPVRDTVKATVGTVRSTKPVKRLQDATLLVQKNVGDVRRTAQQLTSQLLPALPPDLPGMPALPTPGPDNDTPAAGAPQAADAFGSAGVGSHVSDVDGAAAATTAGTTSTQDTTVASSTPGAAALIGTAVSALRDIPVLPSPDVPRPGDDFGASSSVALFVGLLATALLLSLMTGLARFRSRRRRLVPNPAFLPGSSPD